MNRLITNGRKLFHQTTVSLIFALLLNITQFPTVVTADEDLQPFLTEPTIVYRTEGEFDAVKDALVFAVENEGLVITYTSHSSDMYDRTAQAVGVKELVYSDAQTIFFCKASVSHALVQENPHAMILCPYTIGVYSLTKEPGVVYLSIRKPEKTLNSYAAIIELLKGIVAAAIDG